MRWRALVLVSLLISPLAAHAQSEAALKEYFEGRTVKLKLAMPGAEDGVDVYPGTSKPLSFPRHAARLKNYGTAPIEATSALPMAGRPAPGGLPTKGMLQADVDELLGRPKKTSDRMEGRLKVTTRVYPTTAGQVTAEFVEGVMIRFSMTSN